VLYYYQDATVFVQHDVLGVFHFVVKVSVNVNVSIYIVHQQIDPPIILGALDSGQGPKDCSRWTDQQRQKPGGRTCWFSNNSFRSAL